MELTKRRASSRTFIVDRDHEIVDFPTSSPAGTPSDKLATVQGSPVGQPVSVVGKGAIIPVTLVTETSQVVDEDVMATTQIVANAFREPGGRAYLHSLTVLDVDDQGIAFDLYFLNAELSIGTGNSAVSITDQVARAMLFGGIVSIAAGDLVDMGGSRLATKTNVGLMLQAANGSTNLYIGAVSQGTATYASGTLRLGLGLMWD